MKYAFIINPKSGKRLHSKIRTQIEQKFEINSYLVYETKSFSDIIDFVHKAIADKVDCVVAVGGDGTISEVAKHLKDSRVSLGIIPAGSGNGYARNLGLSLNISHAIDQLLESSATKADLGFVNGNCFIGVAGVGYDAHVASRFNQHGKRGSWPYFKIAFKEFFNYKNSLYHIQTDTDLIETEAFIIAIAKSSQFGNGAIIAPQAKLDDAYFDLIILKPMNLIRTLLLARRMFNGTIDQSKYVIYKKVKSVKIKRENTYNYHLDGELYEANEVMNIELHQASLNVMKPSKSDR